VNAASSSKRYIHTYIYLSPSLYIYVSIYIDIDVYRYTSIYIYLSLNIYLYIDTLPVGEGCELVEERRDGLERRARHRVVAYAN